MCCNRMPSPAHRLLPVSLWLSCTLLGLAVPGTIAVTVAVAVLLLQTPMRLACCC
jgi:hypothetical protein